LDDTLAAPHATLGYLLANFDWPPAEREFERALALDPNYATARHWYGLSLVSRNNAAAVAQIERARSLEPLSEIIGVDVASVYRRVGRDDDALQQLKRVIRVHPAFAEGHRQLAELFERLRRYPEALTAFETAARVDPRDPAILAGLATAYGRAGRATEARAVYERLKAQTPKEFVPFFALMLAAHAAGDFSATIAYGRQGILLVEYATLDAIDGSDLYGARLLSLRGRPEFDQLMRDALEARKKKPPVN
jgi:tetratricopeptide (TPR) repeat protein